MLVLFGKSRFVCSKRPEITGSLHSRGLWGYFQKELLLGQQSEVSPGDRGTRSHCRARHKPEEKMEKGRLQGTSTSQGGVPTAQRRASAPRCFGKRWLNLRSARSLSPFSAFQFCLQR